MKKKVTLFLLSVIILSNLIILAVGTESVVDPIIFNGNGDIANSPYCSSGSGTIEDPYIIENLDLDLVWDPYYPYFPIGVLTLKNCQNVIIRNCNLSSSIPDGLPPELLPPTYYVNIEGIQLSNCFNVIVEKCNINVHRYGVLISDSHDNIISDNNFTNCAKGICLASSNNNLIEKNLIINASEAAISFNNPLGGDILRSNHLINNGIRIELYQYENFQRFDIDSSNLLNGKPIYFYDYENNLILNESSNAGQIILYNCNNTRISNADISKATEGILLYKCNNNIITDVISTYNTDTGISLVGSNNTLITGSTFSFNGYCGIQIRGYTRPSINLDIAYNTIHYNGGSGILLEDETTNITIAENSIIGNGRQGIRGYWLDDVIITSNLIFDNFYGGILLYYTPNIEIRKNEVSFNKNYSGIIMAYGCSDALISENIAENNTGYGIYLLYAENCTIDGNTASFNLRGIVLDYSSNNMILNNKITNNIEYGILTSFESDNNTIWLNSISDNDLTDKQGYDDGFNNIWDNGSIGNYWSDYAGLDGNNDGIGDTPYYLAGVSNNQDNFPIIQTNVVVSTQVARYTGKPITYIDFFRIEENYNYLLVIENSSLYSIDIVINGVKFLHLGSDYINYEIVIPTEYLMTDQENIILVTPTGMPDTYAVIQIIKI